MSNSVDQRIVEMEFENERFEKGISESTKSLENLKKALQLDGASEGIEEIEQTASKFNLDKMGENIQKIADHFSVLGIVGTTVIARLTNSMMSGVRNIANTLTSGLIQGGMTRALNLEQAQFQLEGLGLSAEQVKQAMDAALGAVKGTAYGLDEAAKVASQLAATGIDTGRTMENILRGAAGVAAMTNSSFEDIGNIYTTVAGNGRLMGEQLLQLSSRGINAAATLAKYLNKSEEEVRDMVSKGKIDFQTFADAMDNAFGAHAKDANKTFSGSLANMKAALARIGADFFTPYLKNMRDVFNALTGFIDNIHEGLGNLISDVNGAFENIAQSFVIFIKSIDKEKLLDFMYALSDLGGNVMGIFSRILEPVFRAFNNTFNIDLANVTNVINSVNEALMSLWTALDPRGYVANGIYTVFSGLFRLFDTAGMIFANIVKTIAGVLALATPYVYAFFEAIGRNGNSFMQFTQSIRNAVANGGAFDLTPIKTFFEGLLACLPSAEEFGNKVSEIFKSITETLSNFAKAIGPNLSQLISNFLTGIGTGFDNLVRNLGTNDVVNGAIWMGIIYWLRRLIITFKNFTKYLDNTFKGGSITGTVVNTLTQVTDTLIQMENSLRADYILKIAIALAVLAGSLVILSSIDPGKLATAMTALVGLFAALTVATTSLMKAIGGIEKGAGFKGLLEAFGTTAIIYEIGNALTKLAIAILILAAAVKLLSSCDWPGLAKGLIGVGVLLAELGVFVKLMDGTKLKNSVAGLIPLAIGIGILAGAMKLLSTISWEGIAKGLVTLAISLGVIASVIELLPDGELIKSAVSIGIMASAFLVLAAALRVIAGLGWEDLAKGLVALAGGLTILGIALNFIGPNSITGAGALLIASAALVVLSVAMKALSSISWEGLAVGLIALGGSLLILTTAMYAMQEAIVGAGAMLVVAAAVAVLAPALMLLSSISLDGLIIALGALAGVFVIFGIAAMALTPVAPILMAVASSVAMLGLGIAAIGAGLFLFGAGLTMIAASGAAAGAAILAFCTSVMAVLPMVIQMFIVMINSIIEEITVNIPTIIGKGIDLAVGFLNGLASAIVENQGPILDAIYALGSAIVSLLWTALSTGVPMLLSMGAELIGSLINGLLSCLGGVVSAGADLVNGAVNAIRQGINDFFSAGANAVEGFINGLLSGLGGIADAARSLASQAWNALTSALDEHSPSKLTEKAGLFFDKGLENGIKNNTRGVSKAAETLASAAIDSVSTIHDGLEDALNERVDFAPSISPVLDSSNFVGYGKSIDAIFGDKSFDMNVNTSFIRENSESLGDLLEVFQNDQKEVLEKLNRTISDFKDELSNQPETEIAMYVDSKKLASTTAKAMNHQLGILSRRGAI